MTKQEYREQLNSCKKALDDFENCSGSPQIRSLILQAIHLQLEIAREQYRLDNENTLGEDVIGDIGLMSAT